MKEWGFEKYLSMTVTKTLIAEAERRAVEESKETCFSMARYRLPQKGSTFSRGGRLLGKVPWHR
jgi:hypothetical protein